MHKYTLTKPFSNQDRLVFIAEHNGREGLAISEDNIGLYADEPIEIVESDEDYNERMRQYRETAYRLSVDNLVSEYVRKKTFDVIDEAEASELSCKIQNIVNQIKEEYRYR